jgi:hypothetical protein
MNAQEPPEDEIQGGTSPHVETTADGPHRWRRHFGRARASVLLSLAVLAAVVILAGVARTSAGRGATASLGIRTVREPYTALSFVGAGRLGFAGVRKLGSAGVRYHGSQVHDRFSFQITNAEHHALHYGWTVDFDPAGRVYRGSVFLRPGTSATVTKTVLFPCDADVPIARRHLHMIEVRVSLRPSDESIDLLQQCHD